MDVLSLIGRDRPLFDTDIQHHEAELCGLVQASRFLVIGGAGSIGQAVTREIFKRQPKALHVVDISENNMVELVRDIRSTLGYIDGDFRTFALDCGSREFEALMNAGAGLRLRAQPVGAQACAQREGPVHADAAGGGERAQHHQDACAGAGERGATSTSACPPTRPPTR